MVVSEVVARIKIKRIAPVQATNSNNTRGKNMVISNLIPFTNLNLIVAYDFVIITLIKVFGPIQTGVPNISVHSSAVLLLLVFTNSEARSHFKRKMATWRGIDIVGVVDQQQELIERRQTANPQPSYTEHVHLPNQTC